MGRCLLLIVMLAACESALPPPLPFDPDPDRCAAACAKWTEFCERGGDCGCEEAEPGEGPDGEPGTADDESCVAACQAIEAGGTITMNPGCVARQDDCEQARACTER